LTTDDLVYLTRIFVAVVIGFISGALRLQPVYAIIACVAAYSLSIPLVTLLFRGGGILTRRTAILNGMAAYAFIWLTVWILVYNLSPPG